MFPARSPRIRHRSELIERDWENAVTRTLRVNYHLIRNLWSDLSSGLSLNFVGSFYNIGWQIIGVELYISKGQLTTITECLKNKLFGQPATWQWPRTPTVTQIKLISSEIVSRLCSFMITQENDPQLLKLNYWSVRFSVSLFLKKRKELMGSHSW